MNADLLKVLLVLAGAIVMFALNRPRMDVVGLLVMLALPLLGVLKPEEALAGFADPNVVLIGLMFVLGEGLVQTGVASAVGDRLAGWAGNSEARLVVLLMVAVAGIGSVMSSTGVVALFIPIAARIARRRDIAPRRLLMPLSVGALISGMMTLVATPPNLVVQRALQHEGHAGFGFFAFAPFGLILLALAIPWMLRMRSTFAHAGPAIREPEEAAVPADTQAPATGRAPYALGALGVTVILMVTGLVTNVQAALFGCLLMGLGRCLTLEQAYRAIHWPTLVLIVGVIPFAEALDKTGGIDLAVRGLAAIGSDAGPRILLAAIFVLTAVLGMFMSNTATAILMAPVALGLAEQQHLDPHPFAMTVALAASAAFMTPVSSPVNTLVANAGHYRFSDFVRIGVPLTLLALLVTVGLVPMLLPF